MAPVLNYWRKRPCLFMRVLRRRGRLAPSVGGGGRERYIIRRGGAELTLVMIRKVRPFFARKSEKLSDIILAQFPCKSR